MPHQCTNCGRTFADGSKEMLSGCPDCSGTKFQFRPDGIDDGGGSEPATAESPTPADPAPSPDEAPPEPTGDAVSRTVGSAAATVRDLVTGSAGPDATTASPPAEAEGASSQTAPASAEGRASTGTAGDTAGPDTLGDDDIIVAESEPLDESDAQSDARSQIVEPDEMPDSDGFDPTTDDTDDTAEDAPPEVDQSDDASSEPVDAAASGATAAAAEGADLDQAADATADRSVTEEPDAERTERPDLAALREELNEQFESIRVVEPGQYELNLMELYDREEYIIALQEDGRYSIQVPDTWHDD